MTESDIQKQILERIGSRPDVRLWRHNVGRGWVRAGNSFRPQQFGVAGQPDLMGALLVRGVAVWLGVEVKSANGRQSSAQQRWQALMERMGAVYILARSADEAERKIVEAIASIEEKMT